MPGASDPIATDFAVLKPCPACGYNLNGPPEHSRCPECGFDSDAAVMQARVEAWFASWDGLLLRSPPPDALVLLNTPLCRRIALARFLTCFIAPIALAFIVVTLCGCVEVTTIYARWWESPDQPGIRRDLDHTQVSRTAFALYEPKPNVTHAIHRGMQFTFAVTNRMFPARIRIPNREAFLPLALVLVFVYSSRLAAWGAFDGIASTVRSSGPARHETSFVWPALVWLAPPIWFALGVAVAATGAWGAANFLLVPSGQFVLGLLAVAVFGFVVLSASKIVRALGTLRRAGDALGTIFVWLIGTVAIVLSTVVAAWALFIAAI